MSKFSRLETVSLPQRKSPRLSGYDYASSGAYFITICTHSRLPFFGEINRGELKLNLLGDIAYSQWLTVPDYRAYVFLDAFVIMPNHMHGIVLICDDPDGHRTTLGTIIGNYKGAVTRLAKQRLEITRPIWQSRYHDHIIRNEKGLDTIREYIKNNPQRWEEDTFYT